MKVLAAFGLLFIANHLMMCAVTYCFDGEEWFDLEEYFYLSLSRWFKIFVGICLVSAVVYLVDSDSFKSEKAAPEQPMHCVPIEDNVPAEDPINY